MAYATRINDIADYLRNIRPQTSPLNAAMLTRTLKAATAPGTPIVKAQDAIDPNLGYGIPSGPNIEPTPIPNVGAYGTPGTLPANPGPPDPVVTGQLPSQTPQGDIWTRLDPNMGYLQPSLTVTPSNSGGGPPSTPSEPMPWEGAYWPPTTTTTQGISPTTSNVLSKIIGGGASVFGGPLAGIAAGYGSRALLNKLFGTKSVYDPNPQPPGHEMAGGTAGEAGASWFQPGYNLPAGIQAAINRGDYQTAYGQSPQSFSDMKIYNSQEYGGNPNDTRGVSDAGHTVFTPLGANRGFEPEPAASTNRIPYSALWSYGMLPGQKLAGPQKPQGTSLAGDVIQGLDPKLFRTGRG